MVAVKIVTHDRTLATLAETLRESALSTSIQHPNVVRIASPCPLRPACPSRDNKRPCCLTSLAGGCARRASFEHRHKV